MPDDDVPAAPAARPRGGGAVAVAAGIFLSRVAGLVRERVIAHYLGLSPAAAAFRAAMRIPNLLQNLFGEGVLSSSFIPVYARLRAQGKDEEAAKVARVVGTLLALVAATLAALGVLASGPLVDLLAPGFDEGTRDLTVRLVQIMFPGIALLVMSAWCLGVLNSHNRFFLTYVSPVLWNAAIIATAIFAGRRAAGHDDDIATWLAWGTVIGAAAQFLVQLPTVIALLRGITPSLSITAGVRTTLKNFVPIVIGRGSVQISAYVDQVLASYLSEAIVAGMFSAQTLYMLPVSLFGMAISAAELPAMSGTAGDDDARAKHVRDRLASSLRRVVFLVVPSSVAFIAIGGGIVALVLEGGRFVEADTQLVWIILAGSALGLVASTQGRLLASSLYALGDPRSPLYAALARVGFGITVGYIVVMPLRHALGYSAAWGAFGLTAAASLSAWLELGVLLRLTKRRLGAIDMPIKLTAGALAASIVAGAAGYGVVRAAHAYGLRGWLGGLLACVVFGGVYFVAMAAAKVPEARAITRRLRR